jgi:8-oxo-dGTP diphosphatase
MPKSQPAVAGVMIQENKILFLLRKKSPEADTWALPGGKIDFGETPIQALHRELEEELGIEATIGKLIGVTSFVDRPSAVHWISPIYLVPAWRGTPVLQEPHKHAEMTWFAPTQLPAPLMTPTREAMGFLGP